MRAIEQAAIDSGAVTGLDLMERAGQGVVAAILAEWPELATGTPRAVVLCGPGNNGGDGFVVARLLRERGWEVEVFLYGDAAKLPPDARVNYERWCGMGESVTALDQVRPRPDYQLVVDAVFGTGLARPLPAELAILAEVAAECSVRGRGGRVVAVDAPSGICMDSGKVLDGGLIPRVEPAYADLTVSFHAPKIGHFLNDGPLFSGKICTVDIGLVTCPDEPLSEYWPSGVARSVGVYGPDSLVRAKRDLRKWRPGEHKFDHGHVLVLAGPPCHGGAGRLAARGALRIGAGLVTLAALPEAIPENAARLDAIMLRPVNDAPALAGLLADPRITALCLGPGLGTDLAQRDLLAVSLGQGGRKPRTTVLDADALTLLAQHPDLFAALHARCVLTPHGGEFARLFPDIAERLAAPAIMSPAYSKVDAAREAAARAGCVVLFKGPDTVIATPDGRAAIHAAAYDRAAPWLATAGSGDVLAGFIAGLLARGLAPFDAACTAAWLHVECARSFGPGLIAEDLPEELPKVFRALGC